MPFLKCKQLSAAKSASSLAPKTAFGIRFRNLVVRHPTMAEGLNALFAAIPAR
jgi:hypothetical protein